MAVRLGSIPLLAVEAVVLDLETTGLDVRTARMIQIGAVRVRQGKLEPEAEFSTLVDPGLPVPASATAVHGITDADLAGAARPAQALAELRRFIEGQPVIGYAVGFDLAILGAEARRVGAEPITPDFLDTRLLGEVVAPSLPDFTLETLAAWLGVHSEGRHSAIGDARTTARIFCALVPRLRERGIRTWAEARHAARNLPREPVASSAWEEADRGAAPAETEALLRIESYPYRHRVAEVMTSPPFFVEPDTPLLKAIRHMSENRISSVFVAGEPDAGIVTVRDVLRAVAESGAGALERPAGQVASRPLRCIAAESFVYRALGRMSRLKLRHLGVVDEEGVLVGALSARDLLRLRASEAIQLGDAIDTAGDVPALAAAWAPLPIVAETLLAEGVAANGVAAVISRELGAATRRATELAQAELAARGLPAPGSFAVLVLGSAGRGESLLALDQDNAIIFESATTAGGPEDDYFAALGARIADILDEIGVPYCRGGVMAKNEAWRGSLQTWRTRVAGWLARSSPEDLLSVDIFFDARAVYGDTRLANTLLGEARSQAAQAPEFAKLLAAASPAPPGAFNLFGQFRTEQGRIDLKRTALLPIVSSARVLAIRHGIADRATRDRLGEMRKIGRGGESDLDALLTAHETVLGAVLRQQIKDIRAGVPPSSRVEPARMPRAEQENLKAALRSVPHLDGFVRDLLF